MSQGLQAGPEGRITLLVVSPRTPPGLLSWPAWERLRSASAVLSADPGDAWAEALAEAGIPVQDVAALPVGERAGRLVAEAAGGELVWFGGPDGDPGLTDALAEHLSRLAIAAAPPEVELLTGAHDLPGSRLLDLVAVMDRLRSPGGCPWDARQTHSTLLPFLLEEAHEVIEAVESGDRDHLVEELGDLLLQVLFHSRLGEEDPDAPFGIDDVAAGIVAKLVRRHPHVFGGEEAADAQAVAENWELLKAAEKPRRAAFEGIPVTLPALARAQKRVARIERSGADPAAAVAAATDDPVALRLLTAVVAAAAAGVDAEATLREALRRLPAPDGRAAGSAP